MIRSTSMITGISIFPNLFKNKGRITSKMNLANDTNLDEIGGTNQDGMSKDKPKKKRGRKSNKEVDKIENYDPEKTSDVDNLILNLKGGHADSKNILPGYEYSVSDSGGLEGLDGLGGFGGDVFLDAIDVGDLDGLNEKQSQGNCCWNCCHEYTNMTISIPHKYIKEIFYINGNFCSYECAARYIFDTYNGTEMWNKYSLLNFYYNTSLCKRGLRVKPAPSKLLLHKYGGKLSINEYRKLLTTNNQYFNVYLPPIIPISHDEYCYEGKIKNNDMNGELRLYRKKPMSNKNNIYDTMNLKVSENNDGVIDGENDGVNDGGE